MSSRSYWKRRSLLLEQLLDTRAEKTVREIARLYGLAQENIYAQIERVFASYVKGGALTEGQAMELLSAHDTEIARAELMEQWRRASGQVKKDIWARLSAPAYANRITRLQVLRDQLYAQARMMGLSEVAYVRDRLSDTFQQSYYRTIFDTQQYAGQYFDFSRLDDNQIKAALATDWSGSNWSSRIWNNNELFANAVQDTVTVGIMAGLRYDEMRDNLMDVIGMDDSHGARYRSARLVKTECAFVANQGHLLGYEAAEIEHYIFLATLDMVTSEVCRELDMQRFPVAEAEAGTNLPPMHPHCRSTTMPDMTDEELSKIQRFARDASGNPITVPGNMNYREWYAKYVAGQGEQWRDKAHRTKSKDRQQWLDYRRLLGEDAPKSLEEFQQIKYNNADKWAALQLERYKADIRSDIRAGKYDLTFNYEKQSRHLLDNTGYIPGRSYLSYSSDDLATLQAYVYQYAGTGELQLDKKNLWKKTEVVAFPEVIGWVLKEDGTTFETKYGKIHYSRTGIHVVPFLSGE